MAVLLQRHHKKEKKYGPSPSNNYTSGTGKKAPFWKRNKKSNRDTEELGALGAGSAAIAEEKHHKKNKHHSDIPSHETGMTGSTAAAPVDGYGGSPNKYAEPTVPAPTHNNAGYAPYAPQQQAGTVDGYGNTTASGYGQGTGTGNVIHDPNPYAEVHNSGFVHSEQNAGRY